ncbi:F0F1 ATP synthase subunit A [Flavobacterium agricola]|uniref:ATP synthase subunit a n=1 Tax=Flavobacterium agricola TaxID=2870839 RepID=A0ABY6LZQ3_9FLAO|nr:F0F1 ATP synthase subunit A [Flavobacterium agricola]UYW00894.1 F0F1 ATP synthase subunit A [Flavobacterium agricola]
MVITSKPVKFILFALVGLMSSVMMANTTPEAINATQEHAVEHEMTQRVSEHNDQKPEDVNEAIVHHLKDDHYYTFFHDSDTHQHFGFPLPVILIDNGLKVFLSSEFDHGNAVVEKDGQYYKYYHSKIYKTDAEGTITYDENGNPTNAKPLDFSITKNVAGLLLASVLIFLGFTALAKTYKTSPNNLPKGFARVLEPLVLYVRDEMAIPNIGQKQYKKFMPFLLSVFFLIFLLNLLGLTPLGLNVTGNISVTLCLALFTFFVTSFSGNKDYWKHIFWMPGVPVPMKFVLAPIEVLGMLTKPFSLMIRLFANITAGHSVVMGLISVVFIMKATLGVIGGTAVTFLLTTFLTFLELLIAFLQAFIFTMLSSLFIGQAVQEHEEH